MNNANYMDGVPVKIAEKYKPPAPIYKLPQHLANKINLDDNFYWNCPGFSYDLQLEKKALSKIEQWKLIRQRDKEQRKERILRREQERKREDEAKQKIMLYSVSYPSTDDLSSEEEEKAELKENVIYKPEQFAPHIRLEQSANTFQNILQPTILSLDSNATAKSVQSPLFMMAYDSKVSSSFNYKDFEDDTSSPFDNIELKTINDLDVLAQVLHNTQIKSPVDEKLSEINAEVSKDNQINNTEACQEWEQVAADNIPKTFNNLPRYSNDLNISHEALEQFRDHNLMSASSMHYKVNLPHSALTPVFNGLNNSNSYYNYQSNLCNESTCKVDFDNTQILENRHGSAEDQVIKSKSVPDILKELRDEIKKSEIRRYRNCSCNMEDALPHNNGCLTNESTPKNDSKTEDIFSQLDIKGKQLVKQINAMGFPFERVVRTVQLLGADDKKVVEHLIPLSELADLGFEENKISDALIRNENNKNKALDDLVS